MDNKNYYNTTFLFGNAANENTSSNAIGIESINNNKIVNSNSNNSSNILSRKSEKLIAEFEKQSRIDKIARAKELAKELAEKELNEKKSVDINHDSYLADEYIKFMRKANKASLKSRGAVKNNNVVHRMRISPTHGESVNPLALDYYYLSWRVNRLQSHKHFLDEWQGNYRTLKWFEAQKPSRSAIKHHRRRSKYYQTRKCMFLVLFCVLFVFCFFIIVLSFCARIFMYDV